MSKIYFEDTYIAVIPSYQETEKHKHSMLHVFVGNESLRMDGVTPGKLIILEQNVVHQRPEGDISFFLFVDPTSNFADILRNDYLKGNNVFSSDEPVSSFEPDKAGIRAFISLKFGESCFLRRENIDSRIGSLLENIDNYMYLDSRVTDIAGVLNYSESFLTHLFKNETGVSLKGYLLLRRFEYVWQRISAGEMMTSAIIEAGFSSPSHFSDTCRKLTGISASDVLR